MNTAVGESQKKKAQQLFRIFPILIFTLLHGHVHHSAHLVHTWQGRHAVWVQRHNHFAVGRLDLRGRRSLLETERLERARCCGV